MTWQPTVMPKPRTTNMAANASPASQRKPKPNQVSGDSITVRAASTNEDGHGAVAAGWLEIVGQGKDGAGRQHGADR